MSPTELETEKPTAPSRPIDRDAIKRRRRWLYGFAGLALLAVCVFAAVQLIGGGSKDPSAPKNDTKPPVIVERFEMNAVKGQTGHGLGELVTRPAGDGLRVLAAKLKPSLDEDLYQLVLAGGKLQPKLLGNEKVDSTGTFIGEAQINSELLHKYTRIEMRRVTQSTPPVSKLVLLGKIPG